MARLAFVSLLPFVLSFTCAGCGGGGSSGSGGGGSSTLAATPPADWPADTQALLSDVHADPRDDWTLDHPGDKPPALVRFGPGDVTAVALGVQADHLYLRVDFAEPIPTAPVGVPAQNGVAEQTVTSISLSVVVDADRDDQTGGGASPWLEGVDLFFALSFKLGAQSLVYANYDFEGGDLHEHRGQVEGVIGEGGPGSSFVVVRYDLRSIPSSFLPRGASVGIGSWCEAESEGFHELTTDTIAIEQTFFVP